MKELRDEDPMPFGKYKGTMMIDVPASYLIWLWKNDLQEGSVKEYIRDNLECLKKEINELKNSKKSNRN